MKKYLFTSFFLASFVLAPVVYAASDISPRFDGAYDVATETVPWMGAGAACAPLSVESVQIKNGLVSAAVRNAPGAIRGFITAEGYLEATITLAGGRAVPLNGRLDQDLLSAGAIDTTAGCAWLVKITPRRVAANSP
jgi:hypothetical protein